MFYKSKVHIRFKLRTSKRGGQSAVWPPWTWDILESQGWLFLTVSRLKLRKGCSRERSFPEAWSILMLGEEDVRVPAGEWGPLGPAWYHHRPNNLPVGPYKLSLSVWEARGIL